MMLSDMHVVGSDYLPCYTDAIFCSALFCFFFPDSLQQCVHDSVCLLHSYMWYYCCSYYLIYLRVQLNALHFFRTGRTRPCHWFALAARLDRAFTNSLWFLRDNHEGYLLLMTSRQTHNTKGTRYWDANIKLHMYFLKVALHFQKLHLYFSKLLGY